MLTAVNLGWHQTLLRFFVLLFFWSSCRAALVNRIIDDSLGDPVTGFKPIYNPSGSWTDQTCSDCPIQPDRSLAYDGTWTAATYTPQMQNLSITLQFTGISIWVYFILPNANQHGTTVTTNTFVNFAMDGTFICNYTHNPDMSTDSILYNATVFIMVGMSNTPHQLIISTNNVPYNSYLNFDYAMYTTETTDSSTTVPLLSSTLNPSSSGQASVVSTGNTSSPTSSSASSSTSHFLGSTVALPGNQKSNPSQGNPSRGNPSQSNLPGNQGNSQTNSSSSFSSSSSSSSSPHVTTIVGGVLGAFAVIIIACLLFLLLRIKKSKQSASIKPTPLTSQPHDVSSETIEPFRTSPVGLASGVAASASSRSPHVHSRSVSDYTTTPIPAFLPIRRREHTPLPFDREKVRAIRQTEIEEQLNSAQREMENITARQSMPPPLNVAERPTQTDQEMEALREQVRMLSGQIEHLHRERRSDWALGLTNEAPPAYAG